MIKLCKKSVLSNDDCLRPLNHHGNCFTILHNMGFIVSIEGDPLLITKEEYPSDIPESILIIEQMKSGPFL